MPVEVARALGRADRGQDQAGEQAQLRRYFQLVPDHWPVAALTRQLDAGDSAGSAWVRADPARISPDMTGARLLAHGEALAVDADDLEQLLPTLKPLFGDAGVLLDAPHPSRWYLRLPRESQLPAFAAIDDVLGDDLFDHLPEGDAGRRWRALLSEVQVVLHNHPWNARRIAAGLAPINSLWFWGGGVMPHSIRTPFKQIKSPDVLLRSLALVAGVSRDAVDGQEVDALIDLRHLRGLDVLSRDAISPLLAALRRRELDSLRLDFADGAQFVVRNGQRMRFWRRALTRLDDGTPGLKA
ncbi:MAG TPA: phosphoglycerate mutase [Pseudoxanthomonas sp.]|nr:phosphoglycerate mutase [Pseudoxanthomonas sp.]